MHRSLAVLDALYVGLFVSWAAFVISVFTSCMALMYVSTFAMGAFLVVIADHVIARCDAACGAVHRTSFSNRSFGGRSRSL